MTRLLEKAFEEASRLPEPEQNALAKWLLAELHSEARWEKAFAESEDVLDQLADEALEEKRQGKTTRLYRSWMRECFSDPDDPYDRVWHNKIPFMSVPNGDYLAFDPHGTVVYLSHDDGAGHGYVIARSFSELLQRWVPLGCPGPEDWQWRPFTEGAESGILPGCRNAQIWRSLILGER